MKTLAAAALIAISVASSAQALPTAQGTFGFVPLGSVTLDTGGITAATALVTYGSAIVNTASAPSIGNLPVVAGDVVVPSATAFPFAPGLGTIGTLFSVAVHGLTFTFDSAHTLVRIADNTIAAQYTGTLSDGGIWFEDGSPARLSISCTQVPLPGSVINCSNTTIAALPVKEPASLGLLGAALLGFGLLRRQRAA